MRNAAILAATLALLGLLLGPDPARSQLRVPPAAPAPAEPGPTDVLPWRILGPSMPAGRAWNVVGVESDPRIQYVTTAGGGVWRTTNDGTTFEPVFDHYGSASTGAVAVAPSDPDVVWLGTGEPAQTRANSWGDGVYRSDDGGDSWTRTGLRDSYLIEKIVVHPEDPDRVWVAAMGHLWGVNAERGVFRSTDGGASWEKVLFVNDTTGAIDLEMDPHDPDVLYAATWQRYRWGGGDMTESGPGSGIWKSADGGESWERLTDGLPTDPVAKIELAVATHDSRIVYAAVLAGEPGPGGRTSDQGGIYRSDDAGASWRRVSPRTTSYYYQHLYVDPSDDETVWMPVFELNRSTDGGRTWHEVNMRHVHNDLHGMWIDPTDPDHIVLVGDGGVSTTFDRGTTWNAHATPIGQFYEVSVDDQDPWHVIGGMQDTGHWLGPSRTYDEEGITDEDWDKLRYVGDGMASATDPRDPNVIYLVQQFGNTTRLDMRDWTRTEIQPRDPGALAAQGVTRPVRWNWTPAFILSRHDPDYVYLGSNRLFRIHGATGDFRVISPDLTWQQQRTLRGAEDGYHSYGTLFSVTESPFDGATLWVGADDGPIHLTRDLGESWERVDTNLPATAPERCVVAEIEPSRFDRDVAYVALDCHARDDHAPYLYRTGDGGRTWSSVVGDLEDGPTYVVREDPDNPDVLYAGAEHGAYVSLDRGRTWGRLGRGLPTVGVRSMVIQARDRDLVAGTFGRAIWTVDVGPVAEMPSGLDAPLHLYPVERGTRFRWRVTFGNTIEELNGDEMFRAPNPPVGTAVTYSLASPVSGGATVEIRAPDGTPVRSLRGPGDAGVHRVWWDLRSDETAGREYPGRSAGLTPSEWAYGQLVPAGAYEVTVRAGEQVATRTVTVRNEPRDGVRQVRPRL